jgi:hypothetical protein
MGSRTSVHPGPGEIPGSASAPSADAPFSRIPLLKHRLASGRRRWRGWRLDRRARSIIDTIDPARFEEIRARYRDVNPAPGSSKYLEIERWMRIAVRRALDMGLHRQRGYDILDLGTGCGYFPYVCRRYGHRPSAIDLADDPLYNEMVDLLGIQRSSFAIEAGVRLPRFETRFDWVTAFMICFNNHGRDDLWGPEEWSFFLRDLRENLLKPGGRVLLQLNPAADGRFMSPEVASVFATAGASMANGVVRL